MKDELEAAIKKLVEKSVGSDRSEDAMKYAQAALNLSHATSVLEGVRLSASS